MLTPAAPIWEIVLRTVGAYFVILLGLRLAGKRQLGQMTVFDLVVLLLIANAVQNAMVGPDTSLTGGALAVVIILALNFAIARLRLHWRSLRGLIEGSPTVLLLHGEVISAALRHEGIDEETLQAALREHGFETPGHIEMAVLEIDGSISVVPADGSTQHIHRKVKQVKHEGIFTEKT
jgi:uncharacterized membrane protein YcaP (DUF421 family)